MNLHPWLCQPHSLSSGCGEQRPRRWVAEKAAGRRSLLCDFLPRLSASWERLILECLMNTDFLMEEEEQHFLIRLLNYWTVVLFTFEAHVPMKIKCKKIYLYVYMYLICTCYAYLSIFLSIYLLAYLSSKNFPWSPGDLFILCWTKF